MNYDGALGIMFGDSSDSSDSEEEEEENDDEDYGMNEEEHIVMEMSI